MLYLSINQSINQSSLLFKSYRYVSISIKALSTATPFSNPPSSNEIAIVKDDIIYPFPKRQILDPSKLKEFADDNFN